MILLAPEQAVPSFSCDTDEVVMAETQMPVPSGDRKNRAHSMGASGRCRARLWASPFTSSPGYATQDQRLRAGLWSLHRSHVSESEPLAPPDGSLFGGRPFTEESSQNEVPRVGPNLIWQHPCRTGKRGQRHAEREDDASTRGEDQPRRGAQNLPSWPPEGNS